MYANTADEYGLKSGILPPITNANTNSVTPPRNCDIPVTQNGEVPCTLLSVRISDTTVQSDASKIRVSPTDKPSILPPRFMTSIPQKPTTAPIILYMLKPSVFINKNEKHAYKRGASCLRIAAFEPLVRVSPT